MDIELFFSEVEKVIDREIDYEIRSIIDGEILCSSNDPKPHYYIDDPRYGMSPTGTTMGRRVTLVDTAVRRFRAQRKEEIIKQVAHNIVSETHRPRHYIDRPKSAGVLWYYHDAP